jgi:hypothetical protein
VETRHSVLRCQSHSGRIRQGTAQHSLTRRPSSPGTDAATHRLSLSALSCAGNLNCYHDRTVRRRQLTPALFSELHTAWSMPTDRHKNPYNDYVYCLHKATVMTSVLAAGWKALCIGNVLRRNNQNRGFHGGHYEECRLLGYINPVRTSQETHYFSTIDHSQLMLCKIWGFHGGDYEECRLLGYKNPLRTSQETRYFSTTDPSQLMLCKIWGFHGCDYEECRLLGYKNPVRTSQDTHYISTTESSLLMLCRIWGFHGGDYEECRLLGYRNPVCTSQETHYFSATESSQLMLCKIWGFHGCDYEEWRL